MKDSRFIRTVAMTAVICLILGVIAVKAVPSFLEYWHGYMYNEETGTFSLIRIINYFPDTPTIYKENLGGFTHTNFNSYFTHGRDQWMNAGLVSNYVYTASNANFKVYGGHYEELREVMYTFGPKDTGRTLPVVGAGTEVACGALGGNITAYEMTSATVAVKYDGAVSDNMYKNIFTHEMGHGFGWYHHSQNTQDVMYPISSSSNLNLTSRDINHIKQMYE